MMTPRTLANFSGTACGTAVRARRSRRRRGVAMLLVLLALGVGTVLAAASLSSRDNSAAIGQNAQRSAASRWAAEGGMRLALAVLETTFDWSAVSQGRILDKFVVAGASVTVTATTPSGGVPTAKDRELILTAVAEIDGLSATVKERVSLVTARPLEQSINPYLDEFAVFADTSLSINDGAVLVPWSLSPEAGTLVPLRLGTGFGAPSSLTIGSSVEALNSALFSDGSAASCLADSTDDDAMASIELFPIQVPTMGEILPASIAAIAASNTTLNVRNARTENTSKAFGATTVRGRNGVLTLDGTGGAVFRLASLNVRNQGTLRIVGNVRLEVAGALTVQTRGCIELADANSSLTVYTGGDVTVSNAGVGVPRAIARDARRTIDSVSSYVSPAKVRLIALNSAAGGKAKPNVTLDRQALVLAAVHAPQARVDLLNKSAVIGRVSAADFSMASGCALAYDPTLDPRSGFSAKFGPLYENDGTPVQQVLTATASCDPNLGSAWWSMTACNAVRTIQAVDANDDSLAVTEITTGTTDIVDGILQPVLNSGYMSTIGSYGSGSSGSGSSGSSGSSGKGSSGSSGKGKSGGSYGSSGSSSSGGSYGSGSSTSGSTTTITGTVALVPRTPKVVDGVTVRYPQRVVHRPIADAMTGAQQ